MNDPRVVTIVKRYVKTVLIKHRFSGNLTSTLLACLTYSPFVDKLARTTKIPHAYKERDLFWRQIVERIGSTEPVLFLEFGVYQGESMKWFAKTFSNKRSLFYGFDTFTGLPEDWTARNLPSGTFSCDGRTPHVADSRISFVKGLFSDTLPSTIDSIKQLAEGRTVLVHFDADLFSSTLFVLTFIWQWLDRYYFLFDEFFGEESRALSAFTQAYPSQVAFFASDAPLEHRSVPTPARVFGLIQNPDRC